MIDVGEIGEAGDKVAARPPSSEALPLTDVTNDSSTATRTAVVPPASTPPRLSRKDSNPLTSSIFGDLPSGVPRSEIDIGLPSFSFSASSPTPSSTPQARPIAAAAVPAPTASGDRPKPRPAFKLALEARRKAEAEAAEAAKAAEAVKAAVDAAEAANIRNHSPSPPSPSPPSPSPLHLRRPPSTSPPPVQPSVSVSVSREDTIPESSAERGGRRVRKMTAFGEMHAKQIEEKNAKLKAAQKKSDGGKGNVVKPVQVGAPKRTRGRKGQA